MIKRLIAVLVAITPIITALIVMITNLLSKECQPSAPYLLAVILAAALLVNIAIGAIILIVWSDV